MGPTTFMLSTLRVVSPEPKIKLKTRAFASSIEMADAVMVLFAASLTDVLFDLSDVIPPTSPPIINEPVPRYILSVLRPLISQFT